MITKNGSQEGCIAMQPLFEVFGSGRTPNSVTYVEILGYNLFYARGRREILPDKPIL